VRHAIGVLRRFESYAFDESATAEQIADLASALRRCGEFIPEVHDSVVGMNQSEADVALVWEHAYEGPESYARYMCHPYHICILDRYLLPESPECITAPRPESRLGLLGYEIQDALFRRDSGIRRLVAMKAAPGLEVDAWNSFACELTDRPLHTPEVRVSIVAPNTMGLEWWPDGWTHLWEQAYDDEPAMRRALTDEVEVLEAGPIESWVDVYYRLGIEPRAGES
jgi:hypothetical protein